MVEKFIRIIETSSNNRDRTEYRDLSYQASIWPPPTGLLPSNEKEPPALPRDDAIAARRRLKPVAISKLGNVDLLIGLGVTHQARKTPSVEIASSHDGLFTDGVRGDVQPVTALTKTQWATLLRSVSSAILWLQ